jgi:hypothetical protein
MGVQIWDNKNGNTFLAIARGPYHIILARRGQTVYGRSQNRYRNGSFTRVNTRVAKPYRVGTTVQVSLLVSLLVSLHTSGHSS